MSGCIKRNSSVIAAFIVLCEMTVVIFFSIRGVLSIPNDVISLRVIENCVRYSPEQFWIVMCVRPFPNYFILEIFFSKHAVQNNFQIVRGRRVAMQIKRAGGFE